VATSHPGDHGWGKLGGLQHDLGGGGGDLGVKSAHDPGKSDRAAVIGDQQVVRTQSPFDMIQRRQRLPRGGAAHHDRTSESGGVEGM
jgi:hypothetical protein